MIEAFHGQASTALPCKAESMEPWDGPAALFFTNGKQLGATLDRNGLRPVRYCVTKDNRLIMASETGAIPVKPENVLENGRLQPGKMLWLDLPNKKLFYDEEIKNEVVKDKPYFDWIKKERIKLRLLPDPEIKEEKNRKRTSEKAVESLRLYSGRCKTDGRPTGRAGKRAVGLHGSRCSSGRIVQTKSAHL